MNIACTVVALGAFAVASLAFAQSDLIVNGSFEQPAIAPGDYTVVTSIPGWTSTIGDGFEVQNGPVGPAADGKQLIELDGFNNSNLRQIVRTVRGAPYELHFDYSPRPGVAVDSSEVDVYVDGDFIEGIAVDGSALSTTDWQEHLYTFNAAGTSTLIEFRAAGISDGVGGLLDNVRLLGEAPPVAADVPTLGAAAMVLLMLLVGAAPFARRA
jgi:Protein of unknown function (DUF642)